MAFIYDCMALGVDVLVVLSRRHVFVEGAGLAATGVFVVLSVGVVGATREMFHEQQQQQQRVSRPQEQE